jgi:hypothetical protein
MFLFTVDLLPSQSLKPGLIKKTEDFSTNFSKKKRNMCCLIENVGHASFFFPNPKQNTSSWHFVKTLEMRKAG